MTRHERIVGSLGEGEAFSLDGGGTWYSCAVNMTKALNCIAVDAYPICGKPGTIRVHVDSPDQPCLVDHSMTCGDCGRTVHHHVGTTSGYRHAPVTKAAPEWKRPCVAKPPTYVRNIAGGRLA
jgi:hypothetical protein